MLVTERMQALGDHARSSRQPPLKERHYPGAKESMAQDGDVIVGDRPEAAAAPDSAAPPPAAEDAATPPAAEAVQAEPPAPENAGNGAAETSGTGTVETGGNGAAAPQAARADADTGDADLEAAKRAIIHEWENWSALHSDELGDPDVGETFFRHLQLKKSHLIALTAIKNWQTVQTWLQR